MSPTLQRRILSLVAAFAFLATAGADAYGLHSCPHHDALPAATRSSGDAGVHDGHHAAAPTDDHAEHGPCTCVGACSATAVSVPSEPGRIHVTAPPVATVRVAASDAQVLPRIRPHVLPWPNAPPIR